MGDRLLPSPSVFFLVRTPSSPSLFVRSRAARLCFPPAAEAQEARLPPHRMPMRDASTGPPCAAPRAAIAVMTEPRGHSLTLPLLEASQLAHLPAPPDARHVAPVVLSNGADAGALTRNPSTAAIRTLGRTRSHHLALLAATNPPLSTALPSAGPRTPQPRFGASRAAGVARRTPWLSSYPAGPPLRRIGSTTTRPRLRPCPPLRHRPRATAASSPSRVARRPRRHRSVTTSRRHQSGHGEPPATEHRLAPEHPRRCAPPRRRASPTTSRALPLPASRGLAPRAIGEPPSKPKPPPLPSPP